MFPTAWLIEQQVPLLFFLIALLTEPSTWANRATQAVHNRVFT